MDIKLTVHIWRKGMYRGVSPGAHIFQDNCKPHNMKPGTKGRKRLGLGLTLPAKHNHQWCPSPLHTEPTLHPHPWAWRRNWTSDFLAPLNHLSLLTSRSHSWGWGYSFQSLWGWVYDPLCLHSRSFDKWITNGILVVTLSLVYTFPLALSLM